MKITEIKWEQGKKYTTYGPKMHPREVIVDGWLLKLTDGSGEELNDVIQLGYIIQHCDFVEVIQPVSFEEAYKDCKENGFGYTSVKGDQEMYRDGKSVEILEINGLDVVELNVEWIKVVYNERD